MVSLFGLFKKKNKPKIEIRHRVRMKGWIVCECVDCDCSKLSRWEDRLCIECWKGVHKRETHINEE